MRIGVVAIGYGVAMVPASDMNPRHGRITLTERSKERVEINEFTDGEVHVLDKQTRQGITLIFRDKKRADLFPSLDDLKDDLGLMRILFGEFEKVSLPAPAEYVRDMLSATNRPWSTPSGKKPYAYTAECYDWRTPVQKFAILSSMGESSVFPGIFKLPGICTYIWKVLNGGSIPEGTYEEQKLVRVVDGPKGVYSADGAEQVTRLVYFKDDPFFKVDLQFNKDQSAVYDNLEEILLADPNVREFMRSGYREIGIVRLHEEGLSEYATLNKDRSRGGLKQVVSCQKGTERFARITFHEREEERPGRWIKQICDTFRGIVDRSSRLSWSNGERAVLSDSITSNEVKFSSAFNSRLQLTPFLFPELEKLMRNEFDPKDFPVNPIMAFELSSTLQNNGETDYYVHELTCATDMSFVAFFKFVDTDETFKHEGAKAQICSLAKEVDAWYSRYPRF